MVMQTARLRRGGKTPASSGPPNASRRSVSHLGSAQNGGTQANKEETENTRLDGDGDGGKRDKIKPLSSLDSNKVLKRTSTPTKHSSLKVVLGLTVPDKSNSPSVKENKENREDAQSNYSLHHKEIKQSCSNLDEDSEESNNDSITVSKRRKKDIHCSPSRSAEGTMKFQEADGSPLLSENPDWNNTVAVRLSVHDTLKSCLPISWSRSVQEETTSNFVSSEVNALPLFERSDSLKPMGKLISETNNDGLSLLGAAAFLSLGLDKTSLEPSGLSDSSKHDSRGRTIDIAINMPCSDTDNATANGTVKQSSPNLGVDLTLGLPMVVAEELQGGEKITEVNDEDTLLLDEMGDKLATSIALKPDNVVTHLDKSIKIGRQGVGEPQLTSEVQRSSLNTDPQIIDDCLSHKDTGNEELVGEPQLRSEVQISSLNTDPQIIDDCLSHKDTGNEELVGHMGTRKDYMHFSDLSIPLRGTLLLPRGQKRARRFPIQFKRLKNEVLQLKKAGKRETLSKFSRVSAPSGLLAELNPGIISRVRNSKQVHAIIEAVVGPNALTSCPDSKQAYLQEPKIDSRTLGVSHATAIVDNDHSEIVDMHNGSNDAFDRHDQYNSLEGLKRKLEERITTSMNACASAHLASEERPTDGSLLEETFDCLNARADLIPPIECNRDPGYLKPAVGENCNMKGTFNCHCHYCRPSERPGMDITCSASLSCKAATMASHWLELYYQDIKGRLAALKRSRKRVRTLIKEVFGYASSDPISASHANDKLFVQVSNKDQHANVLANAERDHMEKWKSLFIQMDNRLNVEGAQLETSLEQIKEMHAHCKWGLEEAPANGPDNHQLQQPEGLEDKSRSKIAAAKTIERQYAVGAAAASIYSTANLVTATGDVPCF